MPDEQVTRLITQAREQAKSIGMRTMPRLPASKRITLLVTEGPLKGESFSIEKPQVMIGRTEGDIVINDSKISRSHCVVEIHDSYALLVDLDSANGTFVEGKQAATSELCHMSEFRIGATTLMLTITSITEDP